MVWFKVDDNLHGHPKPRAAGLAAMGLWAVCGSHCGQYDQSGFVPDWYVVTWPRGRQLAHRLVLAGLWDEVHGGWVFHEWNERNPSKEDVANKRVRDRERQQAWRDKAVSHSVSHAVTNSAPTRPDPTRPKNTSKTLGGGGSSVPANDRPPQCKKHPEGPDHDDPCRACGRLRKWVEAQPPPGTAAKQRAWAAIAACPLCDAAGFLHGTEDDPVKCKHRKVA